MHKNRTLHLSVSFCAFEWTGILFTTRVITYKNAAAYLLPETFVSLDFVRKRLRRRRKNSPFFMCLGAILLIISLLLVFCDTRVRPVIKRKVRDIARTQTVEILNQILLNEIEELSLTYSMFARINYDQSGEISSIETDTVSINKFKASFALSVTKALEEINQYDFYIRLGTLMGPELLTERGPKIYFNVLSSEYVQTEIISRFEEAGINQTAHKILLDVCVNICCYFPGYTTSVTVQSELMLAETVIIGTVPNIYSPNS